MIFEKGMGVVVCQGEWVKASIQGLWYHLKWSPATKLPWFPAEGHKPSKSPEWMVIIENLINFLYNLIVAFCHTMLYIIIYDYNSIQ